MRRALELVQALLLCAEGSDALPPLDPSDKGWTELMTMLARSDFITRVLALEPLALSFRPALLEAFAGRCVASRRVISKDRGQTPPPPPPPPPLLLAGTRSCRELKTQRPQSRAARAGRLSRRRAGPQGG